MEEGIRQYEEREAACIRQGIPLKSGARELLAYLKERGCVISLASSSIASRARTILDGNGVTDYFDYFTFGPEVENGKACAGYFSEGPPVRPGPRRRNRWFWRTARRA